METVQPDQLAAQLDIIAADLKITNDPNFKQKRAILQTQTDGASKCPDLGFQTELERSVALDLRIKTHQGFLSEDCFISLDFWWGL